MSEFLDVMHVLARGLNKEEVARCADPFSILKAARPAGRVVNRKTRSANGPAQFVPK